MTGQRKVAADGGAFIERPAGNPALEPEPARPVKRTYKVTGAHPVHGTAPGETFTAALNPEQEALLLDGGHISLVEPAKDSPSAKDQRASKEDRPQAKDHKSA